MGKRARLKRLIKHKKIMENTFTKMSGNYVFLKYKCQCGQVFIKPYQFLNHVNKDHHGTLPNKFLVAPQLEAEN